MTVRIIDRDTYTPPPRTDAGGSVRHLDLVNREDIERAADDPSWNLRHELEAMVMSAAAEALE